MLGWPRSGVLVTCLNTRPSLINSSKVAINRCQRRHEPRATNIIQRSNHLVLLSWGFKELQMARRKWRRSWSVLTNRPLWSLIGGQVRIFQIARTLNLPLPTTIRVVRRQLSPLIASYRNQKVPVSPMTPIRRAFRASEGLLASHRTTPRSCSSSTRHSKTITVAIMSPRLSIRKQAHRCKAYHLGTRFSKVRALLICMVDVSLNSCNRQLSQYLLSLRSKITKLLLKW